MDIAEMRQIPIADFLRRLGHEPTRRSGNELWYSAPYRSERTPSLRVNVEKNVWYDFGLGIGGDIFNLAGEFIHSRFSRTGKVHIGKCRCAYGAAGCFHLQEKDFRTVL